MDNHIIAETRPRFGAVRVAVSFELWRKRRRPLGRLVVRNPLFTQMWIKSIARIRDEGLELCCPSLHTRGESMRLFRPCYLAALLALLSPSLLQAAQTGVLTCGATTPITVSYFDISAPPSTSTPGSASSGAGAGKVTFGTLTIHAALQQFGVLAPSIGSQFTSCTLTHNSLTFTFGLTLLTTVDGIAGAGKHRWRGCSCLHTSDFLVRQHHLQRRERWRSGRRRRRLEPDHKYVQSDGPRFLNLSAGLRRTRHKKWCAAPPQVGP